MEIKRGIETFKEVRSRLRKKSLCLSAQSTLLLKHHRSQSREVVCRAWAWRGHFHFVGVCGVGGYTLSVLSFIDFYILPPRYSQPASKCVLTIARNSSTETDSSLAAIVSGDTPNT
jgi:hypothetical protein